MPSAIICLGSNVEPRGQRIDRARALLAAVADIADVSDILESDDISGLGRPYLNQVVRCYTHMTLPAFRQSLAGLEARCGRQAADKASGCVPIDIDLVVWDGQILSPADYEQPFFKQLLTMLLSPHT